MKNHIIVKALKNTKRYIILVPFFSIVISYLTLQVPLFLKYAIDGLAFNRIEEVPNFIRYFFKSDAYYNLLIIAFFLVITIVLIAITSYIRNRISFKFNIKINKNLKTEIFKHITNLEYQSYYNYDKDEMIQRIKEDTNIFSNFFNTSLNLILDTSFFLIFMIKESLELNRTITIYILISVMILILFGIWYIKKLDVKISKMVKTRKYLLSKSISSIRNSILIKMLNKQKEEIEDYNKLNKEYTKSCISFINLVLFHEIITDHIQYLATPIIFMIGGILVINGELTLGSLTVLVTFAEKVMGFFISLGNDLDDIDDFIVINKLLNKLMELDEEKENLQQIKIDGDILFINVTIKQDEKVILSKINLHIKKGEKVAIVGENGAGKSILVKTLLGFYNYTGNIYINNINLKRINKKQIRDYIALVLEESFIFSGTIKDNISLYKNIKEETMDIVTKRVDIYKEIMNFEGGYNAYVGERGITLSGGQKQRIALARTLLQNKGVLVLDEAINKLDEITKTKIVDNVILNNLSTVIIITHDFDIAKRINKIIFLHNGTTYTGTHEELLKNNDYSNMVKINEDLI